MQVRNEGGALAFYDDQGNPLTRAQALALAAATPEGIAAVNEDALRAKARQAIATNDAFLALASPTNAQTLAQVRALTREATALIRLVVRALDSTSGT